MFWPTDCEALRGYGARDISLLAKHVSQPRETYGCDPDECVNELGYVKNLVTKFRSSDSTVSFLDLWKQVLDYEDKHNMFLNMAGLTSTGSRIRERVFGDEKGKTDWRDRLKPSVLSSPALSCQLGTFQPGPFHSAMVDGQQTPRRPCAV